MIGVALALHETFGTAEGVEVAAFERAVRAFVGTSDLARTARYFNGFAIERGTLANRAELRGAFSVALQPHLLREGEADRLEALFRMEGSAVLRERFEPFGDVAATLGELSRLNVPCVGFSTGWPSIDARKADAVGFAQPIVFASDATDGVPPLVRVAASLQLPADRIWFVGTHVSSELLPASAMGFRTIRIDRDGTAYPPGRRLPDATVTSFGDILNVLSGPYTRGLLELRDVLRTALHWRTGHFVSAADVAGSDGVPRSERTETT